MMQRGQHRLLLRFTRPTLLSLAAEATQFIDLQSCYVVRFVKMFAMFATMLPDGQHWLFAPLCTNFQIRAPGSPHGGKYHCRSRCFA